MLVVNEECFFYAECHSQVKVLLSESIQNAVVTHILVVVHWLILNPS